MINILNRLYIRRCALCMGVGVLLELVIMNPAHADTRLNLDCTLRDYSPARRYSEEALRHWLPDRFRIQLSEDGDVLLYVISGPNVGSQISGIVRRENSEKIGMDATQKARDSRGTEAFLTYKLELFKSDYKLAVTATPQRYSTLGRAMGACVDFKPNATAPGRHAVEPGATDRRVCSMATRYGEWQTHNSFELWVQEAKDRGLTLTECERSLKGS